MEVCMSKRELKKWKKKDGILSQCSYHFTDQEGVTALIIIYTPKKFVIGPFMDYKEYNLFQFENKVYELRALDEKDGAIVQEIEGEIAHMSTRDFIKWVVTEALRAKENGELASLADMEVG